jgi:hypothetical protein
MSYRNIEVNGKSYGYSIGRSHVKIRGEGFSKLFLKSEIGQPLAWTETHVVTPANIRSAILGEPGPKEFRCEEHGVSTTKLDVDPFGYEIYRKNHLVVACPKCLDQMGWAI